MCGRQAEPAFTWPVDQYGVPAVPTEAELLHLCGRVPKHELLHFVRSVQAHRRRRAGDELWGVADGAALELARMCADRAVVEGVRGSPDLALGELRWGL